jgi:hypothetical protein
VLEALAAEPDTGIVKTDGRYRLIQRKDPEEAACEPDLFDLGNAAE